MESQKSSEIESKCEVEQRLPYREMLNSEVRRRRDKVEGLMIAGASNVQMARKLRVHEKTIRTDKLAVKDTILREFRENAVEEYIIQVKLQTDGVIMQAWKMHLDSLNNENVRLGALKAVLDALTYYGNLLKQLGILKDNAVVNVFNQQNNVEKANIFQAPFRNSR
jgi:vacuolar-type H+-ATPase subunit I/STV1